MKKACTAQCGNKKDVTHVWVFSQTLEHSDTKNEITQSKKRGMSKERSKAGTKN